MKQINNVAINLHEKEFVRILINEIIDSIDEMYKEISEIRRDTDFCGLDYELSIDNLIEENNAYCIEKLQYAWERGCSKLSLFIVAKSFCYNAESALCAVYKYCTED